MPQAVRDDRAHRHYSVVLFNTDYTSLRLLNRFAPEVDRAASLRVLACDIIDILRRNIRRRTIAKRIRYLPFTEENVLPAETADRLEADSIPPGDREDRSEPSGSVHQVGMLVHSRVSIRSHAVLPCAHLVLRLVGVLHRVGVEDASTGTR